MEKVASTVMFPCKYSSSGCTLHLVHSDKPDHEEGCEFRPYSCPCPGPAASGRAPWTRSWATSPTPTSPSPLNKVTLFYLFKWCVLAVEDIVFRAHNINLPGPRSWVIMQSCFGHHFMLVLEKQEKYDGHQQFFAIVQIIGSWKQAESFIYRLQLNCHRRRLTWEATPRSIHEGTHSAIMNSECLVFDTQVASFRREWQPEYKCHHFHFILCRGHSWGLHKVHPQYQMESWWTMKKLP
ncbi:SIAH2 [Cordylochernes scorpioides]|uniref:E3 ubiquitin-protein ligase n=1 Tax=Cordylochernes scorpioides TaxID=51811 RepID=A0ABY6KJI9_9ARAC|nr:SIAH2 [Cordylochernes scorpioides]